MPIRLYPADSGPEVLDAGQPLPLHACPFCAAPAARRAVRCTVCDSPLTLAPPLDAGEQGGRRRAPRFERNLVVRLQLPGQPLQPARLRDMSTSGLSLSCAERLRAGSVLRVVAPAFETVARVVDCRAVGGGWRVHAQMLTLQLDGAARGVFVSAKV